MCVQSLPLPQYPGGFPVPGFGFPGKPTHKEIQGHPRGLSSSRALLSDCLDSQVSNAKEYNFNHRVLIEKICHTFVNFSPYPAVPPPPLARVPPVNTEGCVCVCVFMAVTFKKGACM